MSNEKYYKNENRILKLFLIEALHQLGQAISIPKVLVEDDSLLKGVEFKENPINYELIAYPVSRRDK